MKLITRELSKKLSKNDNLLLHPIINHNNYKIFKNILQKKSKITIYDITKTKNKPSGEIINVSNHINRTGGNPLIGRQKDLNIDFIDITNIYTTTNGVITDCCGKVLNEKYQHPSHYLCHISILAKALGINAITAHLINFR